MIASLTGTIAEVVLDGAVIDVQGIGYRVHMPASAIAELPAAGATVRLHTHQHVREDAITLYAFTDAGARELFGVLLGVNGIGPKGALQVLSVYPPDQFRRALITEDLDALTLIPGIGKKTAARMILELREKLALPDLEVVPGGAGGQRTALVEVKGALLTLGYSPTEAREAIDRLRRSADDGSVEDLLKMALKELARA